MDPTSAGAISNAPSGKILWGAPPPDWSLAPDEIHLWCSSLEPATAVREQLAQTLSGQERARAARFYFERDRNRFTVGRGLLRTLLSRYLNCKPAEIVLAYSPRGKPSLAGAQAQLHFNLAHSESLVLYAVTTRCEVGVDVEFIRPIREMQAIARRFFAQSETDCLLSLPEPKRPEGFFNCWTRKEAYVKATGEGIAMALDQFEVSLIPGEPAVLLRDRLNPRVSGHWSMFDLSPAIGYAAAVVAKQQGLRIRCWQWNEELAPAK